MNASFSCEGAFTTDGSEYVNGAATIEGGWTITPDVTATLVIDYSTNSDSSPSYIPAPTWNIFYYNNDGTSGSINLGVTGSGSVSLPVEAATPTSVSLGESVSGGVTAVNVSTSLGLQWQLQNTQTVLAATPPTWNTTDGGVDYGYTISNADLPQATTVDFDWASGTTVDTVIGSPIISTTTATAQGSYQLHATPSQLGTPPAGATYLLVVADPENLVSPADPSKVASLALSSLMVTTQPPNIVGLDDTFDVQISAEDANGNVDTSFNGPVTMALDNNPGGATLGGTLTVNAVNGVADFPDLTLNKAGCGYTLKATSAGLTSVDTGSFTVSYIVTNTSDSGPGSLRDMITAVDADPIANGPDQITFASNISGATISLESPLPALTRDQVTITGPINLDGANAGGDGLDISGNQDSVQNLAISSFSGAGISITGSDDTITGSQITGNQNGIVVTAGATGNTIGGTATGAGNEISTDNNDGIVLDNAQQTVIQNNWIGTNSNLTAGLGNTADGIVMENGASNNVIGGTATGAGNIIAYNGGNGVTIGNSPTDASTGDAVLGNAIYGNAKLGIDLGDDGVTLNDSNGHNGPNLFQDFPVLTSAFPVNGTTLIAGTLSGDPDTIYRVEFFSDPKADPTGYGQGQIFLGFVNVTTNSSGVASFTSNVPTAVPGGQFISATATDPAGDTSEFSADQVVVYTPAQIRAAYGFNNLPEVNGVTLDGKGQTIAIVVEQNDPTILSDLNAFDAEFNLTGPASSFVTVYDQDGNIIDPMHTSVPTDLSGEGEYEEANDVEWAHAIAPGASIDVVEANSTAFFTTDSNNELLPGDVLIAVRKAADLPGVSVVSMSFGEPELTLANWASSHGLTLADLEQYADTNYFSKPGVTFIAGSGDNGASGDYPAASPDVVGVGGTSLQNLDSNGDYPGTGTNGEIGWSTGSDTILGHSNYASGGGPSLYELQPAYQIGVVPASMSTVGSVAYRTIPDVSFDADPLTGVAIYNSFQGKQFNVNGGTWQVYGGTSVGAPCWAGLIAIVNEGRMAPGGPGSTLESSSPIQTLSALYSLPSSDYHDITTGYNGYNAGPGYDLVTGLGTPVANLLVPALINYAANNTITTASSDLTPTVYGQSVTFTATVTAITAGLPTPTGMVEFFDGTMELGTGTLDNTGTATFTTSALVAGSHAITVQYLGDSNFSGSTSVALSQTVNQAGTTTALVGSPSPSVYGQMVTFSATVLPVAPGGGTPTGSVEFFDGTTELGTETLDDIGNATFTTSVLAVGSHAITVQYLSDGNFSGSTSDALSQTVDQAGTTTALVGGPSPTVYGQMVTFTAAVSSLVSGGGTPTGQVEFFDGTTELGTETLDNTGSATFTTTALAVGSHAITVQYLGDPNFSGSGSLALSQTVNQAGTTTALVGNPSPSVYGQMVTFTATVSPVAPGGGTPTGTVEFLDGTTELDMETLDNTGTASFTTSALAVGSHSITVQYLGDSNFSASTSSAVLQRVNQAVTTVVLVNDPSPSDYGQMVTFTATVSPIAPGGGVPTGQVEFVGAASELASAPLVNGVATWTTSLLSIGNTQVTAGYFGDSNFTGSNSSTVYQTVNPASTTTMVTSSVDPALWGQSVTFTATIGVVAPGAGTPTGTVTFQEGSTVLGTEPLGGSGTVSFTTSALPAASNSITAVYSGDSNFAMSSSTTSEAVNQAGTSTTLSANPSSSVFGQAVTFTASIGVVSPGAGTPTGTVAFEDGSTTLDTENLGASGTVSFTTSALPVGSISITAVYSGDSNFVMSSSSTTETVNEAGTTTGLSATPSSTNAGQPVTLTATIAVVAPGAGTPTGSVQFFVGGTSLGTVSLSGNTAVLTTTTLAVGTDSLTAQYLGDSNFAVSTSSAVSVTINPVGVATTTTLTSSTNPSLFGQSVTFTATVAPSSGSGTPTGSVTFYDGSTALGTVTLSSKKASLKTTSVPVGSQPITAVYSGDPNYAPSTSTVLTQTVNQDSTTSTVKSSANPSVYAQSVTYTATVKAASPGSGTPTGTVTFYDGTTNLGSGTLAGGTDTLSTTFLVVGTHSITAVYGGDPDFTASTSSALTQTVNQAATTTAVVSVVNPLFYGEQLTFTATVSANSPGSGTPTGVVTFSWGSTQLGTGTLSGGTVSITTSTPFSVGNDVIKASYSGDTNFKTSAGTLTQTVNQDATTTSVVSATNPSVYGQSVTFTATVAANAPGGGTPTGSVTFTNGSTTLGTVTLSGGTASYSTAKLATGLEAITATYNGSSSFITSSANLNQTVAQDATSATVTSSLNPSVYGQSVTFTATVSAASPGSGTPTGTVTFMDGSTALNTATLNGSGKATFKTSALPAGSDSITVVYSGDTNFVTGTSPVLSQTVNLDATTTKLTSSLGSSVYGQSVTFTATVSASSPGSGTPTGTVTFMDGSTSLGTGTLSAGVATFSISTLTVGSHSITGVYSGDPNFTTSTSSTLTQTVKQASTTTSVVSSVNPSTAGQAVTFTATVSPVSPGSGTPTGTATFMDGSNTLGTASLSGGTAGFTTTSLAVGTHSIKVVYSGDSSFKTSTSSVLTQVVQSSSDATPAVTMNQVVDQAIGILTTDDVQSTASLVHDLALEQVSAVFRRPRRLVDF